jgi:hypothetical protein
MKLGSDPFQDAPMSHRIRNIPTAPALTVNSSSGNSNTSLSAAHHNASREQHSKHRRNEIQQKLEDLCQIEIVLRLETVNICYLSQQHQDLLEQSMEVVKRTLKEDDSEKISAEEYLRQKRTWETELERIRSQLHDSQRLLEENSAEHSKWEHDLLILRQALQASASRDMQYGGDGRQSAETLSIEAELSQVQQKAAELHRKRTDLFNQISESNTKFLNPPSYFVKLNCFFSSISFYNIHIIILLKIFIKTNFSFTYTAGNS